MTKNRKKIISKVIASGMLLSNIPIQTFAEEIENIMLYEYDINNDILNKERINIEEGEVSLENNNEDLITEDIKDNFEVLDYNTKNESITMVETNDTEELSDVVIVDNKYMINSIDDLKQLREDINVNNLDTTNMIVELGADIDFAEETSWEPIATNNNLFKGTFDGKNYTIKNLNISGDFKGLFYLTDNSTFKNINFDNVNIKSQNTNMVGLITSIAMNGITAENLDFSNISLVAKSVDLGLIAGASPTTKASSISNISFNGLISGKQNVGGIFGVGGGIFSQIEIAGQIMSEGYTGGVVGILSGTSNEVSELENIKINASLESTGASSSFVGGLIGLSPSALIIRNINIDGDYIRGQKEKSNAGGIIGVVSDYSRLQDNSIVNCIVNTKEISGGYAGGIIGIVSSGSKLDIRDNEVYSNIKGNEWAGGIGAQMISAVSIENNKIKNTSISGMNSVAGITGLLNAESLLKNNTIESSVFSGKSASGIVDMVYGKDCAILENNFKGKIETSLNSTKLGGLCSHWAGENLTVSKNEINAEIISQSDITSGLIGFINSSTGIGKIEYNNVKAKILGKDSVGGLIGQGSFSQNTNIKINNNDIEVNIIANNKVGGLGGTIIGGNIEENKIISTITANDMVGGIVGETMDLVSLYSKNVVSTNITANDKVGGILGSGYPVQIENNFIEGSISGKSQVGGLMGYMSGSDSSFPIIKDSIIAIKINGDNFSNSIIGELIGPVDLKNIYYDTNLTELTDVYGIGLTTSQMQGKGALENMALDFETIWKPNKEFYPTFEQINTAPDIITNYKVVESTITINQYDKFNPLDYITVEDFEGDEVTLEVKETIDTSKYGTFTVTYLATDDKGLSSELTLNLKINPLQVVINNVPTIIVEDKIITVEDKFNPLSMIVAYDKEDGIITDNIKIVKNTVDLKKAGVYEITYEVTDKDGAKATKTIKITVKDKSTSNNNQNNSTTTDKDEDSTDKTDKPQTSDIGLIGISGLLISTVGLVSLNRKQQD